MIKEFVEAKTLLEAIELLRKPEARILAGGTTFFEFYERGLLSDVETIVNIEAIGLDYVTETSEHVRIGANATLEALKQNSLLDAPQYFTLKEAVQKVHPVQVRNVATIGGSLCSSLPQYDPPISLWALDANVVIVGPNQERTVRVDEFCKGLLSPDLNPGEMVKEILIPKHDAGVGSSYFKLGRTHFDYGLVTAATLLQNGQDGALKKVRIVLGNYDEEKPFRALEVENALTNRKMSPEIISEAVRMLDNTSPHSLHASPAYRKEVAKTLVTQSLLESHRRANRP